MRVISHCLTVSNLPMHMKNPIKFCIAIALPLLAGGLGALFTTEAVQNWYPLLNKPFFSPPSWLFGPVWTLLYILMGIACYRVWTSTKKYTTAINIYWGQLFFNAIWSPLFFGLRSPILGLIDIVLMLLLIITTLITFYRIDKIAAYLLIPYLAWVSFATLLNASIWWLN